MAWQLCCRGVRKNLLRSDGRQRSYGKAKVPSNLNCGQKNVSETGPWSDHHSSCQSNIDFLRNLISGLIDPLWNWPLFFLIGDNNHFPQCIARLILTPLPKWYTHQCINSSAPDDMQWSIYILKHNGDFAKQNSTLNITNILSCSAINDFRCISWQKNVAFDWNSIWVYLGYNW